MAVYMATEAWQVELVSHAKAAFKTTGLAMEDYETRHGLPNLKMHLDQEYEVPVSVGVVYRDRRAMVDSQFVPSPATEPCFIRDGARRSVEALNVAAKLSSNRYDG